MGRSGRAEWESPVPPSGMAGQAGMPSVRGSLSGCAYRLDLTNGSTSVLASSIRGHTGCTWQAPESCPNAQKTASLQAEKSVACSDAVVMTLDNPRSEAL